MTQESQHQYFDMAYRTGSDIWTQIPYHQIALNMLPAIQPNSIILDIGSGRGAWAFKLIEHGFRVIGVDYVRTVVDKVNADIKLHAYAEKARFVYGHATDLPFVDNSFSLITEIGVMQHLDISQWDQYLSEINRVVTQNGYILSITLSSETPRFLGFTPKINNQSPYEKFGVSYYFFSPEVLNPLFEKKGFVLIDQEIHSFETRSDPGDKLVLLFSLYQKK